MAESFFASLGAYLGTGATVVGNGLAACSCGVVTAVGAVTAPYWIGAAAGAGACICGTVACYECGCCGAIQRRRQQRAETRGARAGAANAGVVSKKTGAKTAPVARRPAPLRRLRMPKKKARPVGKGPQTIQKNPLRAVEASA
jgi:hypothetical protein